MHVFSAVLVNAKIELKVLHFCWFTLKRCLEEVMVVKAVNIDATPSSIHVSESARIYTLWAQNVVVMYVIVLTHSLP